jgi:hypothetical protein
MIADPVLSASALQHTSRCTAVVGAPVQTFVNVGARKKFNSISFRSVCHFSWMSGASSGNTALYLTRLITRLLLLLLLPPCLKER